MGKSVKLSDIAERLNVSTVTVSKALSGKDGVSEELRAKIKIVANEIGYRYNSAAKSLKEGCTYNVGILIPERFVGAKPSFYWDMYQNVAKELLKHNYFGILEVLSAEDEDANNFPVMISDSKVDGVIIIGQVKKKYVEAVTAEYSSVVFLDFYDKHTNIDTIITDNFYGMYLLTDYLIEMGHKDIAFVGNYHATSSIQDRYLGYMKAMIENEITVKDEWVVNDRDAKGRNIDIELPKKLPTAFVCNCDVVACRVIKELDAHGLKVPEDVSIVGFDNYIDTDNNNCAAPITTVEVDRKVMADVAVETLLQKINDMNYKSGRQLISGKVVIKDSVKKIN